MSGAQSVEFIESGFVIFSFLVLKRENLHLKFFI